MNLPAALLVIRLLIWDTFRQAVASRIFWLMLGVSGIAILFCLSTSTSDLQMKPVGEPAERLPVEQTKSGKPGVDSGVDIIGGRVNFLFGAVKVPWRQYRDDAVRWLQLVLAGGVADTVGLLLTLIWTAAFLPTFLEPGAVTVLLAKPIPRWSLLAGKYLGVLVFVLFQVSIFVIGTWFGLAVRTGIWDPHYLLCIPVLVIHFAIFFSFSSFLAVWTRSTIACVFGSLLFWLLCWGMNYGRNISLVSLAEQPDTVAGISRASELGYWILPKPFDMSYFLSKVLGADAYFPVLKEFHEVEKMGYLSLEASILSSIVFAVVMLGIAGYEFVKADY